MAAILVCKTISRPDKILFSGTGRVCTSTSCREFLRRRSATTTVFILAAFVSDRDISLSFLDQFDFHAMQKASDI